MVGLALAVVEVHVGPQESAWSQHLGSLVLAGAAVLAALVTIRDRRRALANDRFLTNQEHIRNTIDEVAGTMTAAQDRLGDYKSHVVELEKFRDQQRLLAEKAGTPGQAEKLESLEREIRETLQREQTETRPSVQGLAGSEIRLQIRLGPEDEIVRMHQQARETANALYFALLGGTDKNRPQASRDGDKALNEARHEANRAFRGACRAWFAAESPPEPRFSKLKRRLLARGEARGAREPDVQS